jgi:uncharacterized short protein YbdD (DUF466 family)
LIKLLKNLWARVRQLSGDDAYERYLQHYAEHHQSGSVGEAEPLMTKEAFFKEWQDKKWTGVKRCC